MIEEELPIEDFTERGGLVSYCRFIDGDVYAYECEGGVQFWTAKESLNRLCNTFNEAYQYAIFLRDGYGLDVPSYAIEALKADALDEAKRICGPDSAVAEIEHENAKLRKLAKDIHTLATDHGVDVRYPHCDAWDEKLAVVEKQMRELGIEVTS